MLKSLCSLEKLHLPGALPATRRSARPQPSGRMARSSPELTTLTLPEFFQQYSHIPPQTAALGVCDDGLPVLLNLADTQAGPILVTGDPGCGKTALLHVFLRTALERDPENRILFTIIAYQKDEYQSIEEEGMATGRCLGLLQADDPALESQLQQIVTLMEKRRQRKQASAPLLVIMDDLKFLASTSMQVQHLADTILKDGLSVQVWPVAALRTNDSLEMGRWIRHFRTRLIGRMPNQAARRLTIYGGLNTEDLRPQREFAVLVSENWLVFQAPYMSEKDKNNPQEPALNTFPESSGVTGDANENWNVVV